LTTRQCNDERLTDFSLAYGCRYFGLKYLAKSSVNAQHLQRGQQARLKAHGFASIRRCWHMADGKESAIPAIRAALIGLGWRLRTHLQFQRGSAMLGWDDQGKTWSLGGGLNGSLFNDAAISTRRSNSSWLVLERPSVHPASGAEDTAERRLVHSKMTKPSQKLVFGGLKSRA